MLRGGGFKARYVGLHIFLYNSAFTNMPIVRNFEFITNEFNLGGPNILVTFTNWAVIAQSV